MAAPEASPIAREFLTHLGRIRGLGRASLAGQVDDCLERLGAGEYARARSASAGR
jgi:ABC-2 type transport system ATP-binding protein